MSEAPAFAAIDLGASRGRVVVGRVSDGGVALEEVHRFPNRPVWLPDGLRWNLLGLFDEALTGLRRAGAVRSVGVDAWGVDYGLIDGRGRLLGVPFHYRDGRTHGAVGRAFARVPRAELYARAGIQTMPINTVFQLVAEDPARLAAAEGMLLVPDLLALWLSGEAANESTAASTTGLLDARRGAWARDLVERLGLPVRPFGALVEPGAALGPVLAHHELPGAPAVRAVAGHDTAAAFVAAPLSGSDGAVLSSGTWSLLGLELPAPVLGEVAREANLTNERGVDGTTRLLKNVMGMWLLQECARSWGVEEATLTPPEAGRVDDAALFDPDDPSLLAPGGMPERIAALAGVPAGDRAAIVGAVVASLAAKYRWVLERLEAVTGRSVRRIHVVGGGARNAGLCRLTADVCGREVLAGPIEATALGNVLVQARAAGDLGSLAEARDAVRLSFRPVAYAPDRPERGAELYGRFLATTGLAAPLEMEHA